MAKTTYTVPQVPGSRRTSERPYTHAVIGRADSRMSAISCAEDLAKNEGKYRKWDAKDWDDRKRESEATAGQLYRNRNGFMVEAKAWLIESGAEFIGKNPDRAAYVAACAAHRQQRLEKLKAGTAGELGVLQWSMSEANARKSLTTWSHHHSDLHVVPCVPVEKAARRAA